MMVMVRHHLGGRRRTGDEFDAEIGTVRAQHLGVLALMSLWVG